MLLLGLFAILFAESSSSFTLYKTVDHNSFLDFVTFDTKDYNHGNVQYVTEGEAQSRGLLQLNNTQIYLGADATIWGRRKSIKVRSKETFNVGKLFIMDLDHMPAGCGTWPAWWLYGPNWPKAGEIDIIENVNDATQDATTLHTSRGCYASGNFTGRLTHNNCYALINGNSGCGIVNPDSASFGSAFNAHNGGAVALLWDTSGIKAWSWRSGYIPSDILGQKPDPSSWGLPYAAFDFTSCSSSHFYDLTMIINTNFCGDWAGGTFAHDCPNKGSCTSWTNNPENAKEAYWLINYIDIYSTPHFCCLDTQNQCISDPWCNAEQSRCEGPCNDNHDHHWGPAPSMKNETRKMA